MVKPVKAAKRAWFLATHWKIALVLVILLGPFVGYSWYQCLREANGCTPIEIGWGAVKLILNLST